MYCYPSTNNNTSFVNTMLLTRFCCDAVTNGGLIFDRGAPTDLTAVRVSLHIGKRE